MELVEADMRDFVRPHAFNLALSLFTSFGYFDTREEDLAVLRNVETGWRAGDGYDEQGIRGVSELRDALGAVALLIEGERTRQFEFEQTCIRRARHG